MGRAAEDKHVSQTSPKMLCNFLNGEFGIYQANMIKIMTIIKKINRIKGKMANQRNCITVGIWLTLEETDLLDSSDSNWTLYRRGHG